MRSKNEEVLNKIIEIINNSYFQESETPSMKEIAARSLTARVTSQIS